MPDAFEVVGTLVVPTTSKALLAKVKGFRVNADGERVPLADFSMDAKGRFRFLVARTEVARGLGSSFPETVALMGIVPPTEAGTSGSFENADAGVVRIELFPPEEAASPRDVLPLYFQTVFSVPREVAFGVGRVLSLDGAVPLTAKVVGKVALSVVGSDGKAPRSAHAHIVPLQPTRAALGTALPRLPWAEPATAPVLQPLDAGGKAWLFPLPDDGEEPKFQVAVFAEKSCPLVSPQALVKKGKSNAVALTLSACTDAQARAATPAWSARPSPTERVFEDAGANVLFTNTDVVSFDVTARARSLRGFSAKVYAGTEVSGKPAADYQFFTFSSRMDVRLPNYLQGSTRDGRFLIVLESLYSAFDERRWGEPPRATFRGVRSGVKPLVEKVDFTVESLAGVKDVISGVGSFRVVYGGIDCAGGGLEVGVTVGTRFDAKTVPFQRCDPKGNLFAFADLKALIVKAGAREPINFFLRNRYGNVSEHDDERGGNSREVYVDFGAPLLSSTDPLVNSSFGFADKGDALGTALEPWDFNAPANAVILSQGALASRVLRFAGPDQCFTDGFDEVKDGTDKTGRAIRRFVVPTSATGATEAQWKKAVTCGEDLALAEGMVSFPSQANEPASFLLQVEDGAGNRSNAVRHDVPACDSGAATVPAVCWGGAP